MLLTADPSGSTYDLAKARVQIAHPQEKAVDANRIAVANNTIRLRGLESKENNSELLRLEEKISTREEPVRPRAKLDLNNPQTFTDQAILVTIPAGIFKMGSPGQEVETTISRPYRLMATLFTRKFYRKLKKYLGEPADDFSDRITENNPLQNFSPIEVGEVAGLLTRLSRSKNPSDQRFMREIFPDHQEGWIYGLPTEAQLERVFQLARTEDGDKISNKDNIYVDLSVVAGRPLYVDGNKIYIQGSIFEMVRDRYNRDSPLPGGVDPLGTSGPLRVILRSAPPPVVSRYSLSPLISPRRDYISPENSDSLAGFRLVVTEP